MGSVLISTLIRPPNRTRQVEDYHLASNDLLNGRGKFIGTDKDCRAKLDLLAASVPHDLIVDLDAVCLDVVCVVELLHPTTEVGQVFADSEKR